MTATSNLTGQKINRFTHLHQSTEDLVKKVKMQRLLGQKTASCFQRCVGMDAFNAVYSTTYEIDEKYGTHYHENFKKFLIMVPGRGPDGGRRHDRPQGRPVQGPPPAGRPGYVRPCGGAPGRTASWSAVPSATRPALSTPTGTSSCPPSPWVRQIRTRRSPLPCPSDAEGLYMIYRPPVLRHPQAGGERLHRRGQRQVRRPGGIGGAGPCVHPQRVHLPGRRV